MAVGTFVPAAGVTYTVAGNMRFAAGVLTADDGANAVVPVGMNHVYHVQWNVKSAVSNGFVKGMLWAGQSSITCPTVTSGDDFYVSIWGV